MTTYPTETAGALVETRINELVAVGQGAIERVEQFQDSLQDLILGMESPSVGALEEIETPEIAVLNYERPDLGNIEFGEMPEPPVSGLSLVEIEEVSVADAPVQDNSQLLRYNSPQKPDISLSPLQINIPASQEIAVIDPLETREIEHPVLISISTPVVGMPQNREIVAHEVPGMIAVDASYQVVLPSPPIDIDDFRAFEGINLDSTLPVLNTPSMPSGLSFPSRPSLAFDSSKLPEVSSTISSVEMPVAPDMTEPDEPVLQPITFPSPPPLNISTFDIDKPRMDFESVLPAEFSFSPDNYVSGVWDTVLDRIKSDIQTGGVGVSAAIRDGMYHEMLELQKVEHEKRYREAQARYGARGFHLPTGAMISALATIDAENAREKEGFRRKIHLDQMTLAQQNTQWALDKGVQLEQILRDFFIKSEDRRLEVSKAIAQRGIEIFQSYVTKFNAETDLYRSEATVYESRLRGELAKVEMFKAEMEGRGIEAEVQKNVIQAYIARIGILETRAKIFGIQNENAKVRAELEKLKIEQIRTAIEAYLAGVEADKNTVLLYSSSVEAEKIRHDAQLSRTNVELEIEKAKSSDYASRMSAIAQTEVAKAQAYSAESSAATEIARARSSIQVANINAHTEIEKSRAQIHVADMQAKSDLNKSNADIYASLSNTERSKVELLNAEIGAERNKVDLVSAQVNANRNMVDLHSSEWQAEQVKATLHDSKIKSEGLKLDLLGKEIEAERLKIDLGNAEASAAKNRVDLYSSEITAEGVKAEFNAQETNNYAQKLKAWKDRKEVEIANAEQKLRKNDQEIERLKADLASYGARLDYSKVNNSLLSDVFRTEVMAYSADAETARSENTLKIEEMKARVQKAGLQVQKLSEELKLIVEGYTSINQLRMQGMTGLVQAQSQIAASALGAANVTASYGASTGYSYGEHSSTSVTHSYTHSE